MHVPHAHSTLNAFDAPWVNAEWSSAHAQSSWKIFSFKGSWGVILTLSQGTRNPAYIESTQNKNFLRILSQRQHVNRPDRFFSIKPVFHSLCIIKARFIQETGKRIFHACVMSIPLTRLTINKKKTRSAWTAHCMKFFSCEFLKPIIWASYWDIWPIRIREMTLNIHHRIRVTRSTESHGQLTHFMIF